MSLFRVFDISGSGLSAQSVRLNTIASNMANAGSVSSSADEAYRARHPVFRAVMEGMNPDSASASVRVEGIVRSQAPPEMRHAPNHPLANEDGYVFTPAVNGVEAMTDMMSANRSYQNNVEVLNTVKQLMLRTLQLGGS